MINKVKRSVHRLEFYRDLRQKVLRELGTKCAKCGFDDWRALQIDHVNGDGPATRDLRNENRDAYYRYILENKHLFQILCANCNWIKRYENKEYKHTVKVVPSGALCTTKTV